MADQARRGNSNWQSSEDDMIHDLKKQTVAAMAVRDLMSATISLSELPIDLLSVEANDIELAHAQLSRMLWRIRKEQSYA